MQLFNYIFEAAIENRALWSRLLSSAKARKYRIVIDDMKLLNVSSNIPTGESSVVGRLQHLHYTPLTKLQLQMACICQDDDNHIDKTSELQPNGRQKS